MLRVAHNEVCKKIPNSLVAPPCLPSEYACAAVRFTWKLGYPVSCAYKSSLRDTVLYRHCMNSIPQSHSLQRVASHCGQSLTYTCITVHLERDVKAQIPVVASRHDTSRHDKHEVLCQSWRDVSFVLRRACSNMADDEEEVVLACKTISCFIIIYYSSS